MTRPVVFLDIDGVCNSAASCARAWPKHITVDPAEAKIIAAATLDPALVALVQRVCDATGAEVVIASGWRAWMFRDEIVAALRGAGLTAPVVHVLGRRFSSDSRAHFAERWLDTRPDATRFVVIDDTAAHWPTLSALVVPVDGITEADADRAISILRGAL